MTGDKDDQDMKEVLQSVLGEILTEEELASLLKRSREGLIQFLLDSNVPSPRPTLETFGVTMTDDEFTVALEESEERTSRIDPVMPLVEGYAAVVASSITEIVFRSATTISPELLDEMVEMQEMFDYLSNALFAAAICTVAGTLTQLEKRGDLVFMWEWEDE